MAYTCDNGQEHAGSAEVVPAAFLITALDNGDTISLCLPCTLAWGKALDRAVRAAAKQQAEARAEREPEPEPDAEAVDAEAVERLEHLDDGPAAHDGGTVVVRRGTSHSRQVFEARRRAKAAAAVADEVGEGGNATA